MIDDEESLFVGGPGEFDYYDGEDGIFTEEQRKPEPQPSEIQPPEQKEENETYVEPAAVNYPHTIKPKREVTLTLPLHFQHKIITDMLSEDGLLIISRGLGMISIIANLLFQLDVAGTDTEEDKENSLVFVVNSGEGESEQLLEEMRQISVMDSVYSNGEALLGPSRPHRGLSIVNDRISQDKRKEQYSQGGVFSVTSRILVRDMLSEGVVDRQKITAIVVLNAHRVGEYSPIAFILRLFREENKVGTIKAISDQPERFASGFSPLTIHLKSLRLSKTWLWPRFHIKVKDELLEKTQQNWNNTVHEIMVEPTNTMREVSQYIRGCMQARISELKRLNPKLDTESWNIDNAYQTNFVAMIRVQLAPIWHLISWTSKNIVYDLANLRELLDKSTQQDCVSFLKDLVFTYNNGELSARRNNSSWVLLDDAYYLLRVASERVFGSQELISKTPKGKIQDIPVEQAPKWFHLSQVLDEIKEKTEKSNRTGPILIKCTSPKQLAEYLEWVKKEGDVYSAQDYLKEKRKEYKKWRRALPSAETLYNRGESTVTDNRPHNKRSNTTSAPSTSQIKSSGFNKRRRVRGGKSDSPSTRSDPATPSTTVDNKADGDPVVDLTASADALTEGPAATDLETYTTGTAATKSSSLLDEDGDEDDESIQILSQRSADGKAEEETESFYSKAEVVDMEQMILIERYDELMDPVKLRELQPSHIILYEPNQTFVRHVEVYRASNPEKSTEVYFMVYQSSVEESKFLTEVRREKDSFAKLIREKSQMPKIIHDDELDLDSSSGSNPFLRTISSRQAGGQVRAVTERPRVIVDSREFTEASYLPFLLHLNKVQVVPMTLNVGDYIVTDRICVERKTVSDLVQSFSSGRLFEQCANMVKYYDTPVLLIEFDQAKSFSMEPFSEGNRSRDSAKLAQEQVQQNLALLLIYYPKLRIIWSMSPDHAAKILVDLKMEGQEPDVETSRLYGSSDPGAIENSDLENETAIRMLQSIPGINYRNYVDVINNVPNLETLCKMTEEEIAAIIGKESAKKVYNFLNQIL